jgi:serine/threonine-protein kinase
MLENTKRWLLAWAVVSLLSVRAEGDARAQTSEDKAAAEALFQAGRDLMNAGKYDEACPKFEASQHLDAGLGTLLFLGDCYEKAGKLASAWATFREAESIASGRSDQARGQIAKTRYSALEPRLSKLWIKVADGNDAAIVVKRDGEPIPKESWGVALPTDAGDHLVEAAEPGKKPWSKTVNVAGEGANIPVEVPLLEPEPVTASAPPAPIPAPKAATEPVAPPPAPNDGSTQRILSYVAGGIGVVGLGLGTYFSVHAGSQKDDSLSHCRKDQPNLCDQTGVDLRRQALSSADLATAFMIGGGVFLASGVVLFLTAPSSRSEAPPRSASLRLGAAATPAGGHVVLGGDF